MMVPPILNKQLRSELMKKQTSLTVWAAELITNVGTGVDTTHNTRNIEGDGQLKSVTHRQTRTNMRVETDPDLDRSINTL